MCTHKRILLGTFESHQCLKKKVDQDVNLTSPLDSDDETSHLSKVLFHIVSDIYESLELS